MERVNRRGRTDRLSAGEPVVVYVPSNVAAPGAGAVASGATSTAGFAGAPAGPVPNGPLPTPPVPDLLPLP
jgi:hypothetical protein